VAAQFIETREVPLTDLTRFPGNARRGDVPKIRASLRKNGQYRSLVVRQHDDGQLTILAGNNTYDALTAEKQPTARCELIRCDELTARRINLADNRTAELGDYDQPALAELLSYLGGEYEGSGWAADDEDLPLELGPDGHGFPDDPGDLDDGDPGNGEPEDTAGDLLALAGVTIGEPRHKPERGQTWALGPHRLVIADVFTGWPLWAPLLVDGVTFMPYPTPLVPHAPKLGPLVMVQPELYLAGWLLDKWENITGSKPVVLDRQAAA